MSVLSNTYTPLSKAPFKLNVVTPPFLSFETQRALFRLKNKYGDIDLFVSRKLGYENRQALYKAFSAEQIDAIALAIYNIENGDGVIIGDMTGIGKGRIASGTIRYAIVNKLPCAFITEKSSLFTDIFRDLVDIDFIPTPLILNDDADAQITIDAEVSVTKGRGSKKTTTTEFKQVKVGYYDFDGKLKAFNKKEFKKMDSDVKKSLLQKSLDNRDANSRVHLPRNYDFVLSTYSQLQQDNIAKQACNDAQTIARTFKASQSDQTKTKFLREYVKGGIVVVDEAHNAGGNSTRGFYVRELLENARGAVYLSATYAKQPANMPVYAVKTNIKKSNLSTEGLLTSFKRGGVALQEIVASALVNEGQMLRRQRPYDGVEFHYDYLENEYERHKEIFDKVTQIVRRIIAFQREYIETFVEETNDKVKSVVGTVKTTSKDAGTMEITGIFNTMHHLTAALMFSLKAKEVAEKAIDMLNEGQKVVIAFAHTCESYLKELGLSNGEVVESDGIKSGDDFSIILERMLKGVMKCRVGGKEQDILFSDLKAEAQIEYNDIIDKIRDTAVGISLSPIDVLINTIEATKRPSDYHTIEPKKDKNGNITYVKNYTRPSERYIVRECTGRDRRIANVNGLPTCVRIQNKKKLFFSEFNNGQADVLLINQSASTGVSAHSSEKFRDVRKRVMIIHEAELDINQQVQKLGRIFRSGMIDTIYTKGDNMPEYHYVSSSIPAEKRQFMILKRKLKSLDANTTGNQRNSEDTLKTDDFFNKYGAGIIYDYLVNDNREMYEELGGNKLFADPYSSSDDDNENENRFENYNNEENETQEHDGSATTKSEKLCWKVTNRVAVMDVELQEKFYEEIADRYADLITDLKQRGEYDLETEYQDLKAETLKRFVFIDGPTEGGVSFFEKPAFIESVEVDVLKNAKNLRVVEDDIKKSLARFGNKDMQQVKAQYLDVVKTIYDRRIEKVDDEFDKQLEKSREKREKYAEKIADLLEQLDFGKKPKSNFWAHVYKILAADFLDVQSEQELIPSFYQDSVAKELEKWIENYGNYRLKEQDNKKKAKEIKKIKEEFVKAFRYTLSYNEDLINPKDKLKKQKESLEADKQEWLKAYDFYEIGKPIVYSNYGTPKFGIITDIDYRKLSYNTSFWEVGYPKLTIALLDNESEVKSNFRNEKDTIENTAKYNQTELANIRNVWDKTISEMPRTRYKTFMITGNLVLASANLDKITGYSTRLVKYSDNKGFIKAGYLLKERTSENSKDKRDIQISLAFNKIFSTYNAFQDIINTKEKTATGLGNIQMTVSVNGNAAIIQKKADKVEIVINKGNRDKFDGLKPFIQTSFTAKMAGESGNFEFDSPETLKATFEQDGIVKMYQWLKNQNSFLYAYLSELQKDRKYENIDFKAVDASDDDDEMTVQSKDAVNSYYYVLPKPYKAGLFPNEGFIEVSTEGKYGIIGYDKKLSVDDKIQYGLIPYYSSALECLETFLIETKNKYTNAIKSNFVNLPKADAVAKIGKFIYTNSPEAANPEIYFGNISEAELGETAIKRFAIPILLIDKATIIRIKNQLLAGINQL